MPRPPAAGRLQLAEGAEGAVEEAECAEVADHHGGQAGEPEQERAGHAEDVRDHDELPGAEHPPLVGAGDLPQVGEPVHPRLQEQGRRRAGKLVGVAAVIVGGKGGGKPTLAQAGGKDPSKLEEALATARTEAAGMIKAFG